MKKKIQALKIVLFLAPIPLVWMFLSQYQMLTRLENIAMDWRFRARGEIEAPVKVIYADLDPAAMKVFGERPWDRRMFADVATFLTRLSGAKAIGFDFIFSPVAHSRMVSVDSRIDSNVALGNVVQSNPNIVLAATYAEGIPKARKEFTAKEWSEVPLFPEAPTYPVVGPGYGTLGLIAVDKQRSSDAVPRWVPLYTDNNPQAHYFAQARAMAERFNYQAENAAEATTADGETAPPNTGYFARKWEGKVAMVKVAPEEAAKLWAEMDSGKLAYSDLHKRKVVQEAPVFFPFPEDSEFRMFHMAVELARMHFDLPREAVKVKDGYLRIIDEEGTELVAAPLVDDRFIEVNWFSRWNNSTYNPRVSIADFYDKWGDLQSQDEDLRNKAAEWFKQFKDAIVLVGPTDEILQDVAPTPLDSSSVPKVSVHGNLVKTLVSGLYISHLPRWTEVPLILLLTVLVAGSGLYSGPYSRAMKMVSVMVLIGYVAIVFLYFSAAHVVIPVMAPVGSAFSTAFFGLIYKLLVEEAQRSRIKNMFGTYVSPELVNRMVEADEAPKLGGHDEEISIFFSDVERFSSFSELLDSASLVELMNEYLNSMTEILEGEGGTLDKYIGDAIVGMFGAPVPFEDHAYHACVASQKMQLCQEELRAKWRSQQGRWPTLVTRMRTRIGLNTGVATVGNMGSNKRFNYTMMGDPVNLGARCESGAKTYGVYTMVTEDTKNACERYGNDCVFRFLDKIVVRGRAQPVSMYEIIGLRHHLDPENFDCVGEYAIGIEKYLAQDWDAAVGHFRKSAEMEIWQPGKHVGTETNPSLLLIKRCEAYQANPPGDNWDGVFVMQSK